MGNKSQARENMKKAGVPIVPGSEQALADYADCLRQARGIGFPLLIKAAAGGGGKGMRQAGSESDLKNAYDSARLEATHAFGDDRLYLEKIVRPAKHIEVQILADHYGRVLSLGERDCSLQRNRQKIVEEAPAPMLTPSLRQAINQTALRAAKAVNYRNAGTIEFLLDENGNYYFMEMNTRIQVEHAVSEAVCGIDLIRAQLEIAAGEKLALAQQQIKVQGHAIECRINAEDPEQNFCPSAGRVTALLMPGGLGVRVDTMLYEGCDILPYYDAMIAKIITHGANREEALARMKRALAETIIGGIKTNLAYLRNLLDEDVFAEGTFSTTWLMAPEEKFSVRAIQEKMKGEAC